MIRTPLTKTQSPLNFLENTIARQKTFAKQSLEAKFVVNECLIEAFNMLRF